MPRTVLIVATLDTKGREAFFLKERIEACNMTSIVMDVGIKSSAFSATVGNEDIASAVGYTISEIVHRGRPFYVRAMQEGGLSIAKRLVGEGAIHGIIGIGGGTGTSIATYIMRGLPYGFPKIMVSTVASRDVREYVGVKDIFMFHSVADLLGFNSFTRFILEKAALAISMMVRNEVRFLPEKPLIALTTYGINSRCASHIEPLVNELGFELICFHANGTGGVAMEEMVKEGLIKGVLDLTLHEIADDVFGGYCKGAGQKRLEIECSTDIPLVLAPGGLDNAVFSPHYPVPPHFKGRTVYYHDERFCVRVEQEEIKLFAELISSKINKARGPVKILVPMKGFSEIDMEGRDFFDIEGPKVFVSELRKRLRGDIDIEEVDANISEQIFAKKAVDSLFSMMAIT